MTKRFGGSLAIAALLFSAGPAPADPGSGALDGKTFTIQVEETGKPSQLDQILFDAGTFLSSACLALHFEKTAYSTNPSGGGIAFEVKTTSATEGRIVWKGTVTGDAVAGTKEWTPKSGKKETHAFTGEIAAPPAPVDGKTFEIRISAAGKDPHPDKLMFGSGQFQSAQCEQYGFAKAAYSASASDGATAFEATAASPSDGVTVWKGRVRGDAIEGTMEWTPSDGEKVVHTFSGMAVTRRSGPAKPLEGKTFAVQFGAEGAEMRPNELIFAAGMFESVDCRERGYTKSVYRTNAAADGVTFEATTVSATDGIERWKGTIRGDAIDGTMTLQVPGKSPVNFVYSGQLKK